MSIPSYRAFIALGSNLGDRLQYLSAALQRLGQVPGVALVQVAPILETDPVGGPPQEPYLNTAAELSTTLAPRALLDALLSVERSLGRERSAPCAPRTIDLDLLFYADAIINEPGLVVPHPRLHQRRFVLEPLAELDASLRHPVLNKTVEALLQELPEATASLSAHAEDA